MKKYRIEIGEDLYNEIILAKQSLEKKYNKDFNRIEVTNKIGKYLNTLRNNKII